MRQVYPLMLDVTDRPILLVGGGAVAVRKARGLIEAGARNITCVATEFHDDLPAAVRRVASRFEPGHVAGMGLVFALTHSAEVNDQVVQAARRCGILVWRADVDEADPGDFATPALPRAGPVVVTVSAGGSPALAARMRDAIGTALDPADVKLAAAMQQLRPKIRESGLPPARRHEILRDLSSPDAAGVLARGGMGELVRWVSMRYPELALEDPPGESLPG